MSGARVLEFRRRRTRRFEKIVGLHGPFGDIDDSGDDFAAGPSGLLRTEKRDIGGRNPDRLSEGVPRRVGEDEPRVELHAKKYSATLNLSQAESFSDAPWCEKADRKTLPPMAKRGGAQPKTRSQPRADGIAHHVKAWRRKRGLTQEQLAELAGLSTSSISQLEKGTQWFSKESLAALADALRVAEGDLISRDPDGALTEIQAIWDRLPVSVRPHAMKMLRSLLDDDTA